MLRRYIPALIKHPFVRGSPFNFTTYRKLFYSEVDGEEVGAKINTDKTYHENKAKQNQLGQGLGHRSV